MYLTVLQIEFSTLTPVSIFVPILLGKIYEIHASKHLPVSSPNNFLRVYLFLSKKTDFSFQPVTNDVCKTILSFYFQPSVSYWSGIRQKPSTPGQVQCDICRGVMLLELKRDEISLYIYPPMASRSPILSNHL